MMKDYEKVIKEFEYKLQILQQKKLEPIKYTVSGIGLCNKTLAKLKSLVEEFDFETIPGEIHFFKHLKSIPMSQLILFTEMRTCELQKPKAGRQYKINFLEKELKRVNKFFHKNSDFVYYMEMDYSYLDHQFFSRTHRSKFPVSPLTDYYQFPEFSTSHDMLWAKVKAMYQFIHYLRESLEELKPGQTKKYEQKKHQVLVWTASKTALIELIYALYSDQCVNHGAADLKMITSSFEDFFNIKLDQIYKTYSEIKERRGSRTKFLDELIIHLQHKMDKEEGFEKT